MISGVVEKMDELMDGWFVGWMSKWARWMDERSVLLMDEWVNWGGWKNRWMDEWLVCGMSGWIWEERDRRIFSGMDGWIVGVWLMPDVMDGWMDCERLMFYCKSVELMQYIVGLMIDRLV